MKNLMFINVFLFAFISNYSYASPSEIFGMLTIDKMTQGQLLGLKGRVGEANYTFTSENKETCVLKISVAVGSISTPDIGINETEGFTIAVVSQQLNDALIEGKRINSRDWHFTTKESDEKVDGLIVNGIKFKEGFILNSKRRWISWLTGNKHSEICQ